MDVYVVNYAYRSYQNGCIASKIFIYNNIDSARSKLEELHNSWCKYTIMNYECEECIKLISFCEDCILQGAFDFPLPDTTCGIISEQSINFLSKLERCDKCKWELCGLHKYGGTFSHCHDCDEDLICLVIYKQKLDLNSSLIFESIRTNT